MPEGTKEFGKNITYSIAGTILTLVIDLSQDLGPSKSGKSLIIATTSGNKTLEYGNKEIKAGINIYKPNKTTSEPASEPE